MAMMSQMQRMTPLHRKRMRVQCPPGAQLAEKGVGSLSWLDLDRLLREPARPLDRERVAALGRTLALDPGRMPVAFESIR